ncbi:PmoA family protein [Agromyces allii]|uniref:PmoA family protein n=1 Tax=Agromyces allii TaxID=393607 RepID=A0ABN2R0D1_9MICO|nr:PmoA family protein [Agromyces allii]
MSREAPADVRLRRAASAFLLEAGGAELARIERGDGAPAIESPRPYLHPIRTPGGREVSAFRPADHDWHWGLSLAIANVALAGEPHGVNFWGGPTFEHGEYRQFDNDGRQVLREARIDETDARYRAELEWQTPGGRAVLAERRDLSFSLIRGRADGGPVGRSDDGGPAGWVLDWRSDWRNTAGDELGFGSPTTAGRPGAGYGGLFLRAAPELGEAEVLLDGEVVTPEAAMGRRGTWAALRGHDRTVLLAASAENPVAPTPWFVRTGDTVMLCAAPFFDEVWRLPAGGTAEWRWRVAVFDGRPDVEELAAAASGTDGLGDNGDPRPRLDPGAGPGA